MIVVDDASLLPADLGPTAVTIGKFDGVHLGHAALLELLRDEAERRSLAPVVLTFDRNPLEVFAPERAPEPVVSTPQKLTQLAAHGVVATVVHPFTREFAQMSPQAFIDELLVDVIRARLLIVGADFTFGARGAGDVELLRAASREGKFELLVPEDEPGPDGRRVSSTQVRCLLEAGDVRGAAELLGRDHIVSGVVVHGAKRGRAIGFPTANLGPSSIEGMIPADGVYACWLHDGDEIYPAAVSIGNNPTFDGVPQRQVEAYVLDRTLDLYGRRIAVEFVDRIRGMVAFEGIDSLIEGISADVDETRRILRLTGSSAQ